MSFKNWMENTEIRSGLWQKLTGAGYSVEISQYSNKGPMFVIKNTEGQEVGRGYFDLFSNTWKTSEA